MTLIDIYKQLLDLAGLGVDDNGVVIHADGDYAELNGNKLVLPTREHLKNNKEGKTVIHFLRENTLRGESDVFKWYKRALNIRINAKYMSLLPQLLMLTSDAAFNKRINTDQLEYLGGIEPITKTTVNDLLKIYQGAIDTGIPDKAFSYIHLRRNAKLGDTSYKSVGMLHNHILTVLEDEDAEDIYGKKTTLKNKRIFKELFTKVLLPGSSTGTNSKTAPSTVALVETAVSVMLHINSIAEIFNDEIDTSIAFTNDIDILDVISNMDTYNTKILAVPVQVGNEGTAGKEETTTTVAPSTDVNNLINKATHANTKMVNTATTAVAAASAPTVVPVVPTVAPAVAVAPVVTQTTESNTMSVDELRKVLAAKQGYGGAPYVPGVYGNNQYGNNQYYNGNVPPWNGGVANI